MTKLQEHDVEGIEFLGEKLGIVSSLDPRRNGWGTSLEVWRTDEGNFVLRRDKHVPGKYGKVSTKVTPSRKEAQNWLGWGSLALRLYAELDWPI